MYHLAKILTHFYAILQFCNCGMRIKEARAHHSGLFRYGNKSDYVLGTACWGLFILPPLRVLPCLRCSERATGSFVGRRTYSAKGGSAESNITY